MKISKKNNILFFQKNFLKTIEQRLEIILILKSKSFFRKLHNKEIILNRSYFNESSNNYFIDFFRENFFLNFYKNLKITTFSKKQYQSISILLLDFIYSYKGFRHLKGYPVRGQRT